MLGKNKFHTKEINMKIECITIILTIFLKKKN